MNFILVCMHCLDMRDFHSYLRNTPFLDALRQRAIFIPSGRAQGHHQGDSLHAELTGMWTGRCCNSKLTERGYLPANRFILPKTIIEYMLDAGYEVLPAIGGYLHSYAVEGGLKDAWLKDEPERLRLFYCQPPLDRDCPKKGLCARLQGLFRPAKTVGDAPANELQQDEERELDAWIERVINCNSRFYAHYFIRTTHRPWGVPHRLCRIFGQQTSSDDWEQWILVARHAAMKKPDEFAELRRDGLARADYYLNKIFEATKHIPDVTYLVYSNHGEVFDHFRYHWEHLRGPKQELMGTTHGSFPYEVLYANTQLWLIPGKPSTVMTGIGRGIDIAPTILDLAGLKHPAMDGESMLPYFESGSFPPRERFAECQGGCISMVNAEGFKFVSTGIAEEGWVPSPALRRDGHLLHKLAVFDLSSDPHEYNNLIFTSKGQEVLRWAVEAHAKLEKIAAW